jgi:hypothetical protein
VNDVKLCPDDVVGPWVHKEIEQSIPPKSRFASTIEKICEKTMNYLPYSRCPNLQWVELSFQSPQGRSEGSSG